MTLKERFKAKETKLGVFLKREATIFFALCAAVGSLNEYFALVPALSDFVPSWAKHVVLAAGAISWILGKMTVKKDESTN